MKVTTIFLAILFPFFSFGQGCFFPDDTVNVCGYEFDLDMVLAEETISYGCENDQYLAIEFNDNETILGFSSCGIYELIYNATDGSCADTLLIQVSDPNNTSLSQSTLIGLGYGDIDCPVGATADCGDSSVEIFIGTGTPTPVWSFCSTSSCYTTIYSADTVGIGSGCLVDSVTVDTLSVLTSDNFCDDTSQDAFIVLDTDGDTVLNNTFLDYLAQIQDSSYVDCVFSGLECSFSNIPACYDSIVIDTTILPIPVRVGGQWTIPFMQDLVLEDTTYFPYLGLDYELILSPGVEFYGPGNLEVILNQVFITPTDTFREYPNDFSLTLQWEEEWIIDTLLLIEEVPFDTDDDCFACGGLSSSGGFIVPDIPDFPCGPISIYFPSYCDCYYNEPDYALQLSNCSPRTWTFEVLSLDNYYFNVYGASAVMSSNQVELSNPTNITVDIEMFDSYGCFYYTSVNLEDYIDQTMITSSGNLSCEVSSVHLVMSGSLFDSNNPVDMSSTVWSNGSTGSSITVSSEGTYTATHTDDQGCVFTNSVSVWYDDSIECIDENPMASMECDELEEMEIICDVMTLNSFDYMMPSDESYGNQPQALCPDGGAPNNITWFSFVAHSGDYSINILPSGCSGSTNGVEGIQVGLYTDCTFTNSSFCSGECNDDNVSIISNDLVEGQTYYMFIDGCSGSVCYYEMDIEGEPEEPSLAPESMTLIVDGEYFQNAENMSPLEYCPGTSINLQLMGVEIQGEYTWNVNTLEGVPFDGTYNEEYNDVNLVFNSIGTYELCINEISNGCDQYTWAGNMCYTLKIDETEDEDFGTHYICADELVEFDLSQFDVLDPNEDGITGVQLSAVDLQLGLNTVLAVDYRGCQYEQEFVIEEFPSSAATTISIVDCYSELPLEINGFVLDAQTYGQDDEFTFEIDAQSQNINGCDSTLLYTVELLRLAEDFDIESSCNVDGVTINIEDYYTQVSSDASVSFTLLDPNNQPVGSISTLGEYTVPYGSQEGDYTLIVSKSRGNTTCEVSKEITVSFEELEPAQPQITEGPMLICPNEGAVTYLAVSTDTDVDFIWSIDGDVSDFTISGNNYESITIDWKDTGGNLNVSAVNDCGLQKGTNVAVIVHVTPELLLTDDENVCEHTESFISLSVDETLISSYNWDFDGGVISSGNGAGPYSIIWDAEGIKNVELTTTDIYGCTQIIESEIIVNRTPVAAFTSSLDSVCISETIELDVMQSDPSLTYDWDFDDGVNVGADEPIVVFDSPGWKTISLTTENDNCVSSQASMSVFVEDRMEEVQLTCVDQSMTTLSLEWNAIEGADGYLISIGDQPAEMVTSNVFVAVGLEESTIYNIEISVITDHRCPPPITFSSCETTECIELDFSFDVPNMICIEEGMDMINLIAQSSGDKENYIWAGENLTGSTFDPNGLQPGVYTFNLSHQIENCISAGSVDISLIAPPSVELSYDYIVCHGEESTLLELFDIEESYTIFIDGNVSESVSEISVGEHEIVVMNSSMCSYSESIFIEESEESNLAIEGNIEIKEGEEHNYSIDLAAMSDFDVNSIVWTINGEIYCSGSECSSINAIFEMDSDIEVSIITDTGCEAVSSVRILVEELEPKLYIPNIFSPNNDGINDSWFIVPNKEDITIQNIRVIDRWNNLVYTQDANGQSQTGMEWDGKFNGNELQPGVYVYAVTYLADNEIETLYGDVTILK